MVGCVPVAQLAVTFGTLATVIPVGKLSVTMGSTTTPPVPPVLLHVILAVLFCNKLTVAGVKVLVTLLICTVGLMTTKLAVFEVTPVVCKLLVTVATLLTGEPALVLRFPTTFTVMVQLLLAGIEPPVKLTNFAPAVAVTVPPQVFTTLGGLSINAALAVPVKVSLNATAV